LSVVEQLQETPAAIPNFAWEGFVARGGFGEVWLARECVTGLLRAVKVLYKAAAARTNRDLEGVKRYQRCAHNHPHLMQILTVGETDEFYYYVMEAADNAASGVAGAVEGGAAEGARADTAGADGARGPGEAVRGETAGAGYVPLTMRSLLTRRGRLSAREALETVGKVLAGVQRLHEQGLAHFDLKPENILIIEGEPKVGDVGLIGSLAEPAPHAGTPSYLTPDRRADDVYAVGKILYEMISGRPASEFPRLPAELLQSPTPELKSALRIVNRACHPTPGHRFESLDELTEAVAAVLTPPPGLVAGWRRLTPVRKGSLVAGAVLSVVGAVLLAGELLRAREGPAEAVVTEQVLLSVGEVLAGAESGVASERLAPAEALWQRFPHLLDANIVAARVNFAAGVARGEPSFVAFALERLRSEARNETEPGPYWVLIAEILEYSGHADEAVEYREKAAEATPTAAMEWYHLSLATVDLHGALRCVQRAVDSAPDRVLFWARLLHLRRQTGDLEGALDAAERLCTLEPGNFDWVFRRGHAHFALQQFEQAEADYTCVMERGSLPGLVQRGHVRRFRGLYAEALADYTQALARHDSPWVRYQRATILWITGYGGAAADDYRVVRKFLGHPSYADARSYVLLCDLGRAAEGREILTRAAQGGPVPWMARIFECLLGERTPETLVAAADPRNAEQVCEGYYYAGEAARLAGDTAAACACFRRCVGTNLFLDADEYPPNPMNEYDLARWRLRTVCGEETAGPDLGLLCVGAGQQHPQ